MTVPIVTIKFENGVKLLTETVDFIGTNFLFSTMKSRLNFNVTFMNYPVDPVTASLWKLWKFAYKVLFLMLN